MGILTAILSAIGTALSVIVSVVCGIAKALPWWVWLVPIGMFLGIYLVSGSKGCSCRDLGCGCRRHHDPRPPRLITLGPYEVVRAETGASLIVKTGRPRHKREETVALQNIAAPISGKWADISKSHLQEMAGGKVTVQTERHGIFRREMTDDEFRKMWFNLHWDSWMDDHKLTCEQCRKSFDEEPTFICSVAFVKMKELLRESKTVLENNGQQGRLDGEARSGEVQPDEETGFDARVPLTGIVLGESGINLNLEQIKGGYAEVQGSVSAEWMKAQAAAKKKKLGIWSSP